MNNYENAPATKMLATLLLLVIPSFLLAGV